MNSTLIKLLFYKTSSVKENVPLGNESTMKKKGEKQDRLDGK